MSKKYKATSFTKFILILMIVSVSTYLYLEYDNIPINTWEKNHTQLTNNYSIYIHGMPEGHLALRKRQLSIEEYSRLRNDEKLNEETYIKQISTNEVVELIDEGVNSFYIKTKDGTKGFISKIFNNHSTLKAIK